MGLTGHILSGDIFFVAFSLVDCRGRMSGRKCDETIPICQSGQGKELPEVTQSLHKGGTPKV